MLNSLTKLVNLTKSLTIGGQNGVISRGLQTSQVCQERLKRTRKVGIYWDEIDKGKYVELYNLQTGERGMQRDFAKRFKRLDWGHFIRARAGAGNKHWKKTDNYKFQLENYVFARKEHVDKLERAFPGWMKEKRFFPDDPYEKYNRTSWLKHKHTWAKNSENTRRFGNPIYKFNRWNAHLLKRPSPYNRPESFRYEPPGYQNNVHSGGGVYTEEFIPQDTPAPHFQRPLMRYNFRIRDKKLKKIHKLGQMYPQKIPVWHPAWNSEFMYHF